VNIAILALPEGLCIIELHSCGRFGYGRAAADGEAKASYSLCTEVIQGNTDILWRLQFL